MKDFIKNLSSAKKSLAIIFLLLIICGIVMIFAGYVAEIIFYIIAFAFFINLFICARETKKDLVAKYENDHFEYNPQEQRNREMTLKREKTNIIFRQVIYILMAVLTVYQVFVMIFYK